MGSGISRWNTYENQQTAKLLASDLEYALSKGALELYYQPQVKRDGTLYGCEALLRWNYMGQGFVYPPLIIALAVHGGFHRISGHVYCREGLP